jgi:hypothetical protein
MLEIARGHLPRTRREQLQQALPQLAPPPRPWVSPSTALTVIGPGRGDLKSARAQLVPPVSAVSAYSTVGLWVQPVFAKDARVLRRLREKFHGPHTS